jgi:hypothetical protein
MKYKNKFANFFASNDFTGDPITFTLYKQDAPKTLIGGIMSTALLLFMTAVFAIQSIEIFGKINPAISSFLKINPKPEPMTLTRESFPIAIKASTPEGEDLTDELVIKAYLFENVLEDGVYNGNYTRIPLSHCTLDNFEDLDNTTFNHHELQKHLCLTQMMG